MKAWSDIGTSLAAGLAHEARFRIGGPDPIRPSVCADRGRIVRATDQETAHTGQSAKAEGVMRRRRKQRQRIALR
jgi:hypothetical protein